MKNWLVSFICVALITTGGCGGKKTGGSSKNEKTGLTPGKLVFERYSVEKTPEQVRSLVNENINRETTVVVEEKGEFWIILTRGEKRTGGYGVAVSEVSIAPQDDDKSRLVVSYRYSDPPPGMMVTQVLTYPVEVILLKGLSQMPDNVEFVKLQ